MQHRTCLAVPVYLLAVAAILLIMTPPPKDKINAEMKPIVSETVGLVAESQNAKPGPRKHIVAPGQTLSEIAEQYQIDTATLLAANPDVQETIHPGDEIRVMPEKGVMHVVREGDTLWDISASYEVSIEAIRTANSLENDTLNSGKKLWLPGGKARRGLPARGGRDYFIWPTDGVITSGFGERWGRMHAGIDIAEEYGKPIRAAAKGWVKFAGWLAGYGQTIVLEHGHGCSTVYGHLNDYTVSAGEYVGIGQVIASMGSTGNSTGPHLHFEIRWSEQPVNPLVYLP